MMELRRWAKQIISLIGVKRLSLCNAPIAKLLPANSDTQRSRYGFQFVRVRVCLSAKKTLKNVEQKLMQLGMNMLW